LDKQDNQAPSKAIQATVFQTIETLLSKHIGLRENALGYSSLVNTITKAMTAAGFTEAAPYLHHLQQSPTALAALVEATVVPETSFFRNPQSFNYLRHYILPVARKMARPIKVLSIPCSTGEEPYSIAITLIEAGLSLGSFQIEAIDISTQAVEKAQQGIFTPYSFRKTATYSPERHLQQYFRKRGNHYHLNQHVRSQVQFHQGNLIHPQCLQQSSPFDIIFCRNLLIYFHQAARRRTLQKLNRLLHPEGLLFVGYADTSAILPTHFERIKAPHAFVYKKSLELSSKTAKPITKTNFSDRLGAKGQQTSPDQNYRTCRLTSRVIAPTQPQALDSKMLPPPTDSFQRIQALADAGQLEYALQQCDRYLQQHPTHAAAHLLLGEIHQAQGNYTLADKIFQKALYLNPNCHQSLIHRIQLAEQQHNPIEIQRLQLRLKRLRNRQTGD